MSSRSKSATLKDSAAIIGFEAKRWLAADSRSAAEAAEATTWTRRTRAERDNLPDGAAQWGSPMGNRGSAEQYKRIVQGLIFLKYISQTFEEHRVKLPAGEGDYAGFDPEDEDPDAPSVARQIVAGTPKVERGGANQCKAENVFWVPIDARWSHLHSPSGRGRSEAEAEGSQNTHRSVDLPGRVYKYFLNRFASTEGKNSGQFYTPSCVVRSLVEMLAPYMGCIYDPACRSGGIFVQSEKLVESHGGTIGDISMYGQDKWARRQRPFGLALRTRRVRLRRQQPKQSNAITRGPAIMNLATRRIEADIGKEHDDTFRNVQRPDLRVGYVIAKPPFNDSDWFRNDDDVRWQWSGALWTTRQGFPEVGRGGGHPFGVPPKGNGNFGWVQHFIPKLAPQGLTGVDFVCLRYAPAALANGSMSSNRSGGGDIRAAIIEAGRVSCMVTLPGRLFYSTQIPVCLWFIAKEKRSAAANTRAAPTRDRRKHTLFVDARKLGTLTNRVRDADLERIITTSHAWRSSPENLKLEIENWVGSCYSVHDFGIASRTIADIEQSRGALSKATRRITPTRNFGFRLSCNVMSR
jgi:type I restriction enzyme M protein